MFCCDRHAQHLRLAIIAGGSVEDRPSSHNLPPGGGRGRRFADKVKCNRAFGVSWTPSGRWRPTSDRVNDFS